MIDVFVCDDDVNITDFLKFFIMKHFGADYKVVAMNSCQELIGMIEFNEHVPDILIMDINLKDGNGIETIKHLQSIYPTLKVIYLTGVINYATEIFETTPAYFLVKPISENQLMEAITKVSKGIELEKNDLIVIKTNGSETKVYRRDIRYVESSGRKLSLYMIEGRTVQIYEKMDVFQEKLGADFVRTHKSFLANMKHIAERTNKELLLQDGTVIPISKSNLRDVKIKFISYLGEE